MAKRYIPFLDLSIKDSEIDELTDSIRSVLSHGRLLLGPEHDEFEIAIAKYIRSGFATAVGSGTDALFFGMKALGIGKGDEIITTPLSWIASANAIVMLQAEPVFVDVGEDLTINPDLIEEQITQKTKAILAVDYAGKTCEWSRLEKIAVDHGILLIEDGSQAFGAKWDNRFVGSFGDMACISLNPMKLLAAVGEAGVIFSHNKDLRNRLLAERYNGMINKELCEFASLNGRMDTIQAAVLLHRLNTFQNNIVERRCNADYYKRRLENLVKVPLMLQSEDHVFFLYVIQTPHRDPLKDYLESKGIEVRVRDSLLISQQPAYQDTKRGPLHKAESVVQEMLALPISENLSADDRSYVADSIEAFFGRVL